MQVAVSNVWAILADRYMSEYYPEWYARYPVHLCSPDVYFIFEGENAGRFTWDISENGVLTDSDGAQNMLLMRFFAVW